MTIRRPISIDVPSIVVENDAKALNTLTRIKETLKSHVSYRALEPRIVGSVRVDHGRAGLAVLCEARRMTSDHRGGQDNANGGIPEAAG